MSGEYFSFDKEIVIGVTRKQEPKKVESKNKKNNTKNTKNIKKSPKSNQKDIKNNKNKNEKNKINNKEKKSINVNNDNINKKIIKDKISEEKQEKLNEKRKKILRIIKFTMILVLFIILILCAMFSPLFNIKNIIVEGNQKITENEILSLSQIQIDENMYKVNTGKVEKMIKENPYIGEVNIKRKLPSTMVLEIQERTAEFLIEYAGSYLYIDKQGYILEISSEKLELPILQGTSTVETEFKPGNRLDKEDLQKIATVYKIMDSAKTNEIANLITRIDIENIDNIKLIFETEEKTAYIGDITNLVTKMPTIKIILEKEKNIPGEIFVNTDLNKGNAMFREKV